MDEQRTRIVEDLTDSLSGEIRCDPLTVSMYASDASLFQIEPIGVAFPANRDDVVALAKYSAETDIPLIPRGAGSSVCGQPIGRGLVVDCSCYLTRIEAINDVTVRVQPGVTREKLNRVLKPYGRYFPPDPANAAVTTIGGMLAVDAAGSRSVRIGSARDHVRSIEMVVPGGHCLDLGTESLDVLKTVPQEVDRIAIADGSPLDELATAPIVKRTIISKLAQLLADNEELILKHQPGLVRNASGYYLRGIRTHNHLHIARMLVGSEGTLGLFTSVLLHTAPLPEHRGIVLLLFSSMRDALSAVATISQLQPSACDLLDRRVLSLSRESDSRFENMITPAAEAGLIVEQIGYSTEQTITRIQQVVDAVRDLDSEVAVAHRAYSYDDVEFMWSLPRRVVPLLARISGQTRPLPFVEDIAVPPDALPEFIPKAQKVFQQHQVTASLYAHAAAGQLHFRPFLPTPSAKDNKKIERIAAELYELVRSVGGTISGEHGDGISRTPFVRQQYGPLYEIFRQIKDVFDPHNLMNPGKIISDDEHLMVRHFRPQTSDESAKLIDLQLRWQHDDFTQMANSCNGCGTCRTQQPELRMCPFFRLEPVEESSPRSKANVLRNIANGSLDADVMASSEMKSLADKCFNCKQCEIECPSNVNIPQLMIEAKAAYVAAHGLKGTDWLLSRAHSFGKIGCRFSLFANRVLGSGIGRWLIERLFGVHRGRKLPRFARRPFIRMARRFHRLSNESLDQPAVVYFVDHYANFHDPQIGKALMAILDHNSIPVLVPPGQTGSGMAMISSGDLAAARNVAESNVRELVEFAREGYQIVCTEPAAALCLKYEYPMLLDDPDVKVVADSTIEVGDFLLQLHKRGKLKTDFNPLDIDAGYHTPCHLKALHAGTPLLELLKLIPELRVHTIDEGCSGMAGTFGLTKENFRTSIAIGWELISRMREANLTIGTTECSSCKIQMEQDTTKPTLHPLKLLAFAYGLMPEIQQTLESPTRKRVVS